MRTPEKKRIKTKQIALSVDLAKDPLPYRGYIAWSLDEDITLLGVEVTVVANPTSLTGLAETDYWHADAHASRAPDFPDNAIMGSAYLAHAIKDVTIGLDTHMMTVGQHTSTEVIMFPEGFGIDFDAGDYLYACYHVHLLLSAGGGGTCSFLTAVNFFYVER